MEIRFTSGEAIPMYGQTVEEVHLDIDQGNGPVEYVVRERDGAIVLDSLAPMSHTTDEARHQPDEALAGCRLNNGSPCAFCVSESERRRKLAAQEG